MSEISTLPICPSCGKTILPGSHFCPNCGTKLSEGFTGIGIGRQIYVYLISVFLPPFGLIYTFRYRNGNTQAKRVGILAAVFTIISLVLTIWLSISFIQTLQNQLNSYSSLGI